MSRFSILRIDHYDPAAVGRKNRILFSIFILIPGTASILFNLGNVFEFDFILRLVILLPLLGVLSIMPERIRPRSGGDAGARAGWPRYRR